MAKPAALTLGSGGLHSLVATALAAREFRLGMLHVRMPRPDAAQALAAFTAQVEHFSPLRSWVVEMPCIKQMLQPADGATGSASDGAEHVLPYRDLQLLTVAVGFAHQMRASTVYWGCQPDTKNPDAIARVVELLQLFNQTAELLSPEHPVTVQAPLLGLTDVQVLQLGQQMGVPLALGRSCTSATATACMGCPACVRRTRSFRAAQLPDPLLVPAAQPA